MKKTMTAAVCIMAWAAFAAANDVAKNTDTNTVPVVLNVGNLRPGGKTTVFKASDFKEMEKIDLSDITRERLAREVGLSVRGVEKNLA